MYATQGWKKNKYGTHMRHIYTQFKVKKPIEINIFAEINKNKNGKYETEIRVSINDNHPHVIPGVYSRSTTARQGVDRMLQRIFDGLVGQLQSKK